MAENQSAAKTSAKGWLVFCIIFAYSVTVCMAWFNMTGTGVKYVMSAGNFADFGGLSAIGYAMSAVSISAIVMAVVAGPLIRAFGGRTTMLISMVFSVIGVAICAASGMNFYMFMAGRVISGCGVGLCGVSCTTLVSLWIADRQKGLALAIWGIWVPVGMLIAYNAAIPIISAISGVASEQFTTVSYTIAALGYADASSVGIDQSALDAVASITSAIDVTWWIDVVLLVIEAVLCFIVVRDPDASEATEVSAERVPYSDPRVMSVIKDYRLWCLCIAWFGFNFCNMAFTNNMSSWFSLGGFSWSGDATTVQIANSILSACAVIAPFWGIVYDKINKYKKWLFVAFGNCSILLMCIFGFKAWGDFGFWVYAIFQVLGNSILVAAIRPYVPMLTGKGGATAVSLGFTLITFLQQLGNTLSGIAFGAVADISTIEGMAQASWMTIVPAAAVAFVCSLFIRLPKQQGGQDKPQA